MKNTSKIFLSILICLNFIVMISASLTVYRTFWKLSLKPGYFIEDKIEYVENSTDIKELQAFILKDFSNRKQLAQEEEGYVNTIFISGVIVLVSAACSCVFLFYVKKDIKSFFR